MPRHHDLVTVDSKTLQNVLSYLTSSGDTSSKRERQLALVDLLRVYHPSVVEEEKLLLLCENAGFFKVFLPLFFFFFLFSFLFFEGKMNSLGAGVRGDLSALKEVPQNHSLLYQRRIKEDGRVSLRPKLACES